MRLRTIGLIVILALGLLVGLLSAEAQQAEEVYRIGYLGTRDGIEAREEAFRKGLRELGYIEGQNIVIEWRFSNRMSERLRKFAAELVRLKVDVIVSRSTLSTRAAKQATSTIPIVMVNVGDPVGRGLITSFAQPGGNVTGSTTQNTYIAGKRLELLKEAFPQVSRVAVLSDPKRPGHEVRFKRMEVAARALGVQLQSVAVRRPYDFEGAFRAATKEPNDALVIVTSGLSRSKARIVGLAAKSGLPTTYTDRRFVRAGGLMSFQADRLEQFRRVAIYVDKILKGTKPSDLPVERPTKFQLSINLKTARKMGLTIPPSVLYQAAEVIQ